MSLFHVTRLARRFKAFSSSFSLKKTLAATTHIDIGLINVRLARKDIRHSLLLFGAFALVAVLSVNSPVLATQYIWSLANSVAGNWDTSATNWTGASGTPWDATNGPNNDARFNTSGTVTVLGTVYTNRITYGTPSRIIAGGTVRLDGTSPAINTISGTLNEIHATLDGSAGVTINSGGQVLRMFPTTGNIYTGGTLIKSGSNLEINTNSPFSTGTVTTESNVSIRYTSNPTTLANNFSLANGTKIGSAAILGATQAVGTFSGTITLSGTASGTTGGTLPTTAIAFSEYVTQMTFNNPISGTGDLAFRGGSAFSNQNNLFILKGGASTYAGNTWLWTHNLGNGVRGDVTLRLDAASPGSLPAATVLTMTQGATNSAKSILDLNGNNQMLRGLVSATIDGATGGGWFVNNSNNFTSSTLTLNPSNIADSYTFDGVLRNHPTSPANSVLALKKQGAGTQALTGLSTYSGGTEISGGKLLANTAVSGSNSATGVGNVSVLSGGTLGGTGQITPTGTNGVSVSGGGFIAPGASIGTLTFNLGSTTGKISMLSGSGFQFELGTPNGSIGSIAPGSSDLLTILNAAAADMSFTGNTIDLLNTATGVGYFKLFDTSLDATTWTGLTTGGATTGGNFITSGLTVANVGGGLFGNLILADGSSGTSAGDIYLSVTEASSAVPEPSTLALALLGLVGVSLLARRPTST